MIKFIKKNTLLILILFSLLLTIYSWIYSAYIFRVSFKEELGILAGGGFLSIWQPSISVYWIINIVHMFVMIGLIFSPRYFRGLLLLSLIFNYGSSLFLGYSVSPPVEDFISTILIFVDGLIVALVFQSKGAEAQWEQ